MVMFQNLRQSGRVRQLNVLNCLYTLLIFLLWAVVESDGQPRLVGGTEAQIHEFPFQVLLILNIPNKPTERCGGSLINKKWILTAGHCVSPERGFTINERYLTVRLGAHYRHSIVKGEIKVDVERTYPHPYYSEKGPVSDIGLIKLKTSVPLKKGVIWPISLPPVGAELRDGTHVTVLGWGASKAYVVERQRNFYACGQTFPAAPSGKKIVKKVDGCGDIEYDNKGFFFFPNALQRSTISTRSQEKCLIDRAEYICAASKTSVGCIGDSGSALAVPGQTPGSWVIYGVMSHGSYFCIPEEGGMYTKVIANLAWIKSHTNDTY